MKAIIILSAIVFLSCSGDINKTKEEKFKNLCSCMDKAYEIESFDKFNDACQSCFDNIQWKDEEEFNKAHEFLFKNCPNSLFRREQSNLFNQFGLREDMFIDIPKEDCRKYFGGKWLPLGAPEGSYSEQIGNSSKTFMNGKLVIETEMLKHEGCTGTFKVVKNYDKETFFQFEEGTVFQIETVGVYDSLVLNRTYFGEFSILSVGYKLED